MKADHDPRSTKDPSVHRRLNPVQAVLRIPFVNSAPLTGAMDMRPRSVVGLRMIMMARTNEVSRCSIRGHASPRGHYESK